ncbi:nitroreductase [Arthrobacter ginsengisoli]|uniref:Nitroreductase n=1 Tax=Arthrobacter ginsengisoli TaxID=1356565 RepID=A0ABU1UI65_9MICC|nr:nitroreductase family protein [Arthrobacter ginsengisoli]MDR7084820.1 nitroreductase [Arthrobacter ginsengisoli]
MSGQLPITDFETVLTTTRAVRRRLDFDRAVPAAVVHDSLRIALQAPTGGDAEDWRFVLVNDSHVKAAIGAEYLRIFDAKIRPRIPKLLQGETMRDDRPDVSSDAALKRRAKVYETAAYLAENIGRSPWLVLACATRPDSDPRIRSAVYGSVFPAIWSFQLALRSRGLGSVITTLHLREPEGVTQILGIPEGVTQCALLPVAYTIGADFRAASRKPVEDVSFMNHWGHPVEVPSPHLNI